MEHATHDPIIAFALGGLAGNNAHGAGFLYRATQHGLEPRMISCTSGQIAWVYHYLQARASGADLRAIFERDIAELHRLHNINLDYARLAVTGKPGVFRLAFPEYSFDLARNTLQAFNDVLLHRGNVFWLETMLRTLPGRLLVPDFAPQLLNAISTAFNQATIGIAFNSYNPRNGQEIVYLNQVARNLLSPSGRSYQPGYASRHRASTSYEAITPQAVLDGLWIYQYGFDKPENCFVDGAYYRQMMLSELTFANTIFAVRPICSRWLGEAPAADGVSETTSAATVPPLPRSYIGIEDLKTEVNFNGSYVGERAQIALMNKLVRDRDAYLAEHGRRGPGPDDLLTKYHLIDLLEVEIQVPRSFFDYVFESMAVFDAAGRELDRVLEAAGARGEFCLRPAVGTARPA
jgi:hypothetical protein